MEPTTCSSSSSNVLLIFSRSTSDGRHSRSNSSTSERDGLGRFPGRGLGAKWVYVMWTRSNWISARSPPSTPLEGKMATYLSQQEALILGDVRNSLYLRVEHIVLYPTSTIIIPVRRDDITKISCSVSCLGRGCNAIPERFFVCLWSKTSRDTTQQQIFSKCLVCLERRYLLFVCFV